MTDLNMEIIQNIHNNNFKTKIIIFTYNTKKLDLHQYANKNPFLDKLNNVNDINFLEIYFVIV